MPAPSLSRMVQNTIARNIANLQDVGDLRYDLVRPLLKQITNPEQLRALELASPQVAENDEELWKSFIVRDIPDCKNKIIQPGLPNTFCYELYRTLKKQEDDAQKQQEDQLRKALQKIDKAKDANKTQILDKVISLPRGVDNPVHRNPTAGGPSLHQRKAPAPPSKSTKGPQIIQALRNKSRVAVHNKMLNTAARVRPQMSTSPMTVPKLPRYPNEDDVQKSIRMAHQDEARKRKRKEEEEKATWKAERERRRAIKHIKRQEMSEKKEQEISQHSNPSPSPPPSAPQPVARNTPSPPSRTSTPSPFKETPPPQTSPAPAPPRDTTPKPVTVAPASYRRPVSIFAPKPPKRRGVA